MVEFVCAQISTRDLKKHTIIYFKAFGYEPGDFIPSEISGRRADDICHIDCRGMGGNPTGDKDRIENLMAQTREEHTRYGDKACTKAFEYQTHLKFLEANGVRFDRQFMLSQMEKYALFKKTEQKTC